VTGGTEVAAIWPPDLAGLDTVPSPAEASVQDLCRFRGGERGLIAAARPLLASLWYGLFLSGAAVLLSLRVRDRWIAELPHKVYVLPHQRERERERGGPWRERFLLVTVPCHDTIGSVESTEHIVRRPL
jgi:hypothetical protein